MKNQEHTKRIDENALRDDFSRVQKQIAKWNKIYPLGNVDRDEVSGIHYVEEGTCDYKVSTSSASTV